MHGYIMALLQSWWQERLAVPLELVPSEISGVFRTGLRL